MLELLARHWWTLALRGAAAVLFGLMALIWPGVTITVLVLLFGAYALVDGVVEFGAALFGGPAASGRRGWLVFEGAIGILAGLGTFTWPGITALVLLWWIAVWALLTGVVEIVAAVRLRREIEGEWLLAAIGLLSVLFGVLLAVRPGAGAIAVTWLIGSYAIVFGGLLLAFAFELRRVRGAAGRWTFRRPARA